MLVFYDVALSPFAQKVKLALLEKDIAFETVEANLGSNDPEFLKVSPRGEVPALVDDGLAVFDSSIMLEYLEDKWPNPPLRPATPEARARVRMIEEICDGPFEAVNWGLNEVLGFKRADGAEAQAIVAHAGQELARIRDWLADQLGEAPWFGGGGLGLGDIVVYPYMAAAARFRFGPLEGSPLAGWLASMAARPSVQRVEAEAKAALPRFRELGARFLTGAARRQYRDHRLEFMLRAGGLEIVRRGMEKDTIRFSELP